MPDRDPDPDLPEDNVVSLYEVEPAELLNGLLARLPGIESLVVAVRWTDTSMTTGWTRAPVSHRAALAALLDANVKSDLQNDPADPY